MKAEDIIKAYDSRKSERSGVEDLWNLIERFIMPFGGQFFRDKKTEGGVDWKKREIFDSTGINANQLLASNIQSSITNPVTKWANYSFDKDQLNKDQEAQEWMQECEYLVMNSVKSTNFNNEAGEFYLDLTGFANGIQCQESSELDTGELDKITFDTVPPDECVFDLDLEGYPRNFYRCYSWTALQIYDKFAADTPELIRQEAQSPTKSIIKHKVIFAIYKRPEITNADVFSILPADKRPYGGRYVLHRTKEAIGKEVGYYEMPIAMTRWRTVSGSNWGFSPAMIAIWDVLSLNQTNELILKAGEKVLDPAILTTNRGVFGDIDLSAAGLTVVSDVKAIAPFESKARFDVSQMNKEDLRQSVKDTFYWDQLQLKNSPAMTAYEVQTRIQLMQRLIGPTYGRLHTHYLDPTLERHFRILYRYKKLPPMPDIVAELKGSIVINYTGPLASAQRMDEVQNMESTLQNIAGISEMFPEARDLVDVDESVREIVSAKGAPAKMLRTKTEVKKIRDDRAAQQQQQMQLEQAQQAGQAMQAVGAGQESMRNAN